MPGALHLRLHLGEAEVDHLDEVAAEPHRLEDDVLRLEIAVDDVEVVRLAERGEDLDHDVDDALEGEEALLVHHAGEVLPAQVLHHQVELPAVLPEVDHGDRVGVVEAARGARLRDEADRGALVAEQVRVDDLDGDRAAERLLLGAVHAPHAADPHQLEDHVAAGQRGADQRVVTRLPRELRDREPAHRAELMGLLARVRALRADDLRHGADTNTDAQRGDQQGVGGRGEARERAPSAGVPGRPARGFWAGGEGWANLPPDAHTPPASRPAPRRRQVDLGGGPRRGPRLAAHGRAPPGHAARRAGAHQRDPAHADPLAPAQRAVGVAAPHRVLPPAPQPRPARRRRPLLPGPHLRPPRAQPGRHPLRRHGRSQQRRRPRAPAASTRACPCAR